MVLGKLRQLGRAAALTGTLAAAMADEDKRRAYDQFGEEGLKGDLLRVSCPLGIRTAEHTSRNFLANVWSEEHSKSEPPFITAVCVPWSGGGGGMPGGMNFAAGDPMEMFKQFFGDEVSAPSSANQKHI